MAAAVAIDACGGGVVEGVELEPEARVTVWVSLLFFKGAFSSVGVLFVKTD